MASDGIAEWELKPRNLPKPEPGDEIVISGISGRFPESDNVEEFQENLRTKRDLVTDDDRRWKLDHPEIPQRTGKINKVEKFDALFFGVHFKQAHTMDPMCRILLEHAYEAIIDAGVNPKHLRGTRTGVFIGACFSESEKTWFYEKLQVNGFGITGCARAMLSNRISYWLGVNGPSYTIDTACSSGLYALEHAYRAIQEGLCDAALVGAGNLCLHPYVSMQFFKLGVLNVDGRCKAFDEEADGYVRSEAFCMMFLQKAKDANRVYATVVHGKLNCDGYKEQGVTFPSSHMQSVLLKEFYIECGIPPSLVGYVEAHGTGTKVGDPEEVNAIDRVFSPDRKKPLLIGSCKSNMGHSEPASGLCSVSKAIISLESGMIPPNINFKTPRQSIQALQEGRIKVVTDLTPLPSEYIAINSFGFGGANAHVLLKANPKQKINNGAPKDNLPRLVVTSGRTEEAVHHIINKLKSKPVDAEYVHLYHKIHADDINGHMYRGYTILPEKGVADSPPTEVKSFPGTKRPVWFVFSGMGSQWPGMGESLLRLPVFAEAIKKCDAALKPFGVDIYHVITNKDKSAFDNILNSFVGIAAVQIGLVDVLHSLGIEPNNIIGHSVGELGCAYADGCFTAEQMILAAYSRGIASIETKVIHGSMAAVGMGFKELRQLCPPDIEVACHNASQSATISGPAESMKKFVAELTAKKIFAREVPCSNIPYHSRYIAPAGPKLLDYLQKIIPNPNPRSAKWLSTSVPIDKWDTAAAKYSSAEYHTNNLLNAVLFEEVSALIPKDAIAIEIAPHGLLQAIVRRSLAPTVANIPLTLRGHSDNLEFLLQALGKMYLVGMHPKLANLYPPIQLPVSRSTPMIAPLIKWEHSDDWYVTSYKSQQKITSGERIVKISLTDSDYESMAGHIIDGRNLFPATGYLALVWETVGMMHGELYTEVSVVFNDVRFLRATNIPKDGTIEFTITISKGTGRFEVVEGGAAVVTGYIAVCSNPAAEKLNAPLPDVKEEEVMDTRDIYKELRLRGYHYSGLYKNITSATIGGTKGHITWNNEWVSFMDNMLQMQILGVDTRGLFVPTTIKKLVIDTKEHLQGIKKGEVGKQFAIYVNKLYDVIVCGGVEIRGLQASAIARKKPAGDAVLEEYKFVPHYDRAEVGLREISRLTTHIATENHLGIKIKTVELIEEADKVLADRLLSPFILESLGDLPLIQADVSVVSTKSKFDGDDWPSTIPIVSPAKLTAETNAVIAVGHRLLTKDRLENLNLLLSALEEGGFLLTREKAREANNIEAVAQSKNLNIILEKKFENEVFILLKKQEQSPDKIVVIPVSNNEFTWVDKMRVIMSEELEKETNEIVRILFVGQEGYENGLLGLINCLRKEPGGESVRGLLIQDPKAPKFSLQNAFYAKELQKDLAVSVVNENGLWGSYRHLPLPGTLIAAQHAWMGQKVRGDLSSLTWFQGPIQNLDRKDQDLVNIHYAPINFKDVMLGTGKLAVEVSVAHRMLHESMLGLEYSGITSTGRRVMGFVPGRAIANLCILDPTFLWDVPQNWSLEDAATIPCVYGTCYYALYINGNMKKGDKVLIHAGTGGIGQAAINLALYEGCEVFTTVGTPEKRDFIRKHFPQIPESHIGNSRDTSFEKMIIEQTNGEGVDIVLNSLAEEKLLTSVNCLRWGGRFLEIGKFDLAANNPLGMQCFLNEIKFVGVMFDRLSAEGGEKANEVCRLLSEGIKKGAVKPLTRIIFEKDQVEEAFRFMAAGKHYGKVIIKVHEDNKSPRSLPALPRFYCLQDRSYVILGGLGGFGLELADWLVLRNAKHLIITSRTGLKNGYQRQRVKLWESYGVRVIIISGKDASKRDDCQAILETAAKSAPVDAIFNLAVVLKDAVWQNQNSQFFEESFRSKAWATKNLDVLSRKICPKLRHFVVFSSVSCGRGNAGQTNYGMSNSVMERICERRVLEGLPGLAIQWGAVGDVGLVADMQEDNKELIIGGTLQQKINSCLEELDGFLQQKRPVVASMVVAEKRAGGAGALSVVDTVLNIMGLKDLKGVSLTTSLAELGMDSMMSVEIKQTLEREFEVFLTAQDIRALNFAKLQEMSDKDEASTDRRAKKAAIEEAEEIMGLRLLARLAGSEEINNQPCERLPSKEELGREEVFLIPGIEGLSSVFLTLAPNIKAPATCLQGLISNSQKSIPEIADEMLKRVLERSKNRRFFFIVGYSYGATLAIELMRRLESHGFQGRLLLIDGAPEHLKTVLKEQFKADSVEEFQNNILLSVLNMTLPSHSAELIEDFKECNDWKSKFQALISRLPTQDLKRFVEDREALITAVYNRLTALQKYDVSQLPPLKAPIILLKPTIASCRSIADDYGLSKMTSDKVEVFNVTGNHVTMLDHEKVAAAINGEAIEDKESFDKQLMEK